MDKMPTLRFFSATKCYKATFLQIKLSQPLSLSSKELAVIELFFF
jgi:hypothetical protein